MSRERHDVPRCKEDEYVRCCMNLARQIGTSEFPVSCPESFMYIPSGYDIWSEMCVAHVTFLAVNEE